MIKNKFAVVLAERLLKLSKVSQDTGISRTTLTSLYYRRAGGVSLRTIDTLCRYLACRIEDIFEYEEVNP